MSQTMTRSVATSALGPRRRHCDKRIGGVGIEALALATGLKNRTPLRAEQPARRG